MIFIKIFFIRGYWKIINFYIIFEAKKMLQSELTHHSVEALIITLSNYTSEAGLKKS